MDSGNCSTVIDGEVEAALLSQHRIPVYPPPMHERADPFPFIDAGVVPSATQPSQGRTQADTMPLNDPHHPHDLPLAHTAQLRDRHGNQPTHERLHPQPPPDQPDHDRHDEAGTEQVLQFGVAQSHHSPATVTIPPALRPKTSGKYISSARAGATR